jgi:FkbM family methyltransferase|tara:strand:- start:1912 stop:2547 length:636 start_codon:yes stop_codon:yes gene_type:complete
MLKVREGTTDKDILKEIKPTYGWLLEDLNPSEERVLDVGGNIGAYCKYAWNQGARKIWSFEPEPSNFELLTENTRDTDIQNFNEALVSNPSEQTIDFFVPKNRKNMGGCSLEIKGGRDTIQVKTRKFSDVLEEVKPTIIKMDCEGAEYDLLLNTPLPESVKRICIELHLGKKEWRYVRGPQVINLFKDWEEVRKPVITDKNWHTILKYRRD